MSKKKFPLSIRFVGPDLERNSTSILDLGESLIALQRVVHKAYLISAGRHFRHATVPRDLRRKLALQIAERKPGSDLINLDWMVHEVLTPLPASLLSGLILMTGKAMGLYAYRGIAGRLKKLKMGSSKAEERRVDELAVRLYNEIQDLVSRVGLEPAYSKGEKVFGEDESIVGVVDKAHTYNRNCVEVRSVNGFWVKVCMKEKLFNKLLVDLTHPRLRTFTFDGRAVYRVGRSIHWFNEFEADAYHV